MPRVDPAAPGSFDAQFELGYVQEKKGDLDDAISSYRDAIRLKPRDAQAQMYLGTRIRQGMLADAVAALRQATGLAPDNAAAQVALGHMLEQAGKLDEAIAAYRKTFASSPTTPKPLQPR